MSRYVSAALAVHSGLLYAGRSYRCLAAQTLEKSALVDVHSGISTIHAAAHMQS